MSNYSPLTCRPSVMYDLCGPSGDGHGENGEFQYAAWALRWGAAYLLNNHRRSRRPGCSFTHEQVWLIPLLPHFVSSLPPVLLLFFPAGKLIQIDQNSLRASMRPGWEDLLRRCIQMFLQHSDGQPWSHKRHYHEGGSNTNTSTNWKLAKYLKLSEFILLSSVKSSMKAGGKIKRMALDLINCVLTCVFKL